MLGERGLWYKMSFFEHASRVPLIVNAPRRFAPRRVAQSVSLVDILPTLVEIAGDGDAGDYAMPLDGRSLLPHLSGAGGHDEVIGEYLAEGAVAPLVMIRRGRHKFIHAPGDPDQLYDLAGHLVAASLSVGAYHSWDFQPFRDASRQYVRNHLDLDDIEAAARLPRRSAQ